MSRSRRKTGKTGILIAALLLVMLGIGAGGYLATRQSSPVRPPADSTQRPQVDNSNSVNVTPRQTVEVYIINTVDGESSLVAEKRRVSAKADRYEAALDGLLENAGTVKSAIPKGTKLRSLEITGDLAVVDLTNEFVDNFNGGSEVESFAINAIVRTMAQFNEIKKVQILVDGRKIGTLGGHFELLEPIDVKTPPQNSGAVSE